MGLAIRLLLDVELSASRVDRHGSKVAAKNLGVKGAKRALSVIWLLLPEAHGGFRGSIFDCRPEAS